MEKKGKHIVGGDSFLAFVRFVLNACCASCHEYISVVSLCKRKNKRDHSRHASSRAICCKPRSIPCRRIFRRSNLVSSSSRKPSIRSWAGQFTRRSPWEEEAVAEEEVAATAATATKLSSQPSNPSCSRPRAPRTHGPRYSCLLIY